MQGLGRHAGGEASKLINTKGAAMIYVPAIDRFLMRLDDAGGAVYEINPTTFEVSLSSKVGSAPIPETQNGPYNKFLYVPRLQGAI